MADRSWNTDGRVLTTDDARQVVEHYRAEFAPRRAESFIRMAAERGRGPEIDDVFWAALGE